MKSELLVAIIASILVGMLIAFGLVLLFTFFASSEACKQTLLYIL